MFFSQVRLPTLTTATGAHHAGVYLGCLLIMLQTACIHSTVGRCWSKGAQNSQNCNRCRHHRGLVIQSSVLLGDRAPGGVVRVRGATATRRLSMEYAHHPHHRWRGHRLPVLAAAAGHAAPPSTTTNTLPAAIALVLAGITNRILCMCVCVGG